MLVGYARVSTGTRTLISRRMPSSVPAARRSSPTSRSGARRSPVSAEAITYLRPGDTLAVWKLDRLGRSLKQLIETIEDLEVRDIGFRSLTEAIDTTTAGGRLVFQIFGALAEFERQVIRERIMAGLAAARAMGRKGGRPPALSPKDLAAAKALLKDPAITVEEVARRLRVGPSTLYRHLPGGGAASLSRDSPRIIFWP